jgi:hypothetical protein
MPPLTALEATKPRDFAIIDLKPLRFFIFDATAAFVSALTIGAALTVASPMAAKTIDVRTIRIMFFPSQVNRVNGNRFSSTLWNALLLLRDGSMHGFDTAGTLPPVLSF